MGPVRNPSVLMSLRNLLSFSKTPAGASGTGTTPKRARQLDVLPPALHRPATMESLLELKKHRCAQHVVMQCVGMAEA